MCVDNTNILNDLRMLCLIDRNIKDECIYLETMSSVILYTTLSCMSLRRKCEQNSKEDQTKTSSTVVIKSPEPI